MATHGGFPGLEDNSLADVEMLPWCEAGLHQTKSSEREVRRG